MYLNIFNDSFNRIGSVDAYEDLEFTLNYYGHSLLVATIDASEDNILKFIANDDEMRILTKSTDFRRGYVVDYADFRDSGKTEIVLIAKSLSTMLNWRIIERTQVESGNVVDVMNRFVSNNAINHPNPNRKLPNLVIGQSEVIDIITNETYTDKFIDESLWEMCEKHEISYEILMNHDTRKYEFIVFSGTNRTTVQQLNPHIIFSQAFGNVISQSYLDDKSNYKSTAYVAGEGEGAARTILKINDEVSGFKRREVFFDARDLQSRYNDDNNNEVIIPESRYTELLRERGFNRMADYKRIRTFTNDADSTSQHVYGRDYFLGDLTTSRNDRLGLVMHSRVVVAKENYNEKGYSLKVEFGEAIPNVFDKFKKAIKGASVTGGAYTGYNGVGLQYSFTGSSLGVKREDEVEFTYVSLKGDTGPKGDTGAQGIRGLQGIQGIQGLKGDTGLTGATGLQGIQGVKGDLGAVGPKGEIGLTGAQGIKGDTGITGSQGVIGPIGPQGLKGDKGDTGAQGIPGLKGDKGDIGLTGVQGIQGVKGDNGLKGDKPAHQWSGTQLRLETPTGVYGPYVNLIGPIGLTGPKGDKGEQGIQGIQGASIADSVEWANVLNKPENLATTEFVESAVSASGDNTFILNGITNKYTWSVEDNGILVFGYTAIL